MAKKTSSVGNVYKLLGSASANLQDIKRVPAHPHQYSLHWKNTGSDWKNKK
jgi:hypothetical protein